MEGSLIDQYFTYWGRILMLDFGPSLSAFPTPVATLIARALPWTIGLLFTCTMLAWLLGNVLGGLAGYYRKSRTLKLLGVVAMGFHPIPYYIIAFVLLIVFGYLWPVLPISGGAAQNVPQALSSNTSAAFSATRSCQRSRSSWSASVAGSWACGRSSPTSSPRTMSFTPNSAASRESASFRSTSCGTPWCPQITGLAMSLGAIFNGAIIVEQVFSYPGLGRLLIGAVYSADYSLVLGVTAISIIAVSASVFLIDILYPIFDPRVQLA